MACRAIGRSRATHYRRHRTAPPAPRQHPVPHRERVQPQAVTEAERTAILGALRTVRLRALSVPRAWAALRAEGVSRRSLSTFYRLLRAAGVPRRGARLDLAALAADSADRR